jgi:hypothetical protein
LVAHKTLNTFALLSFFFLSLSAGLYILCIILTFAFCSDVSAAKDFEEQGLLWQARSVESWTY